MGMCAFGYIFQAKVDKVLGDIKGIKTYIYDILVLSKDSFEKNSTAENIIWQNSHFRIKS